jgi:SagB-type dehydrogenase family enzyme
MLKNIKIIELPQPRFDSDVSIEEALLQRMSVRHYTDEPLTLVQVSQLLWSVQGITPRPDGRTGRTAPSAGATYPLEIYLTVKNVQGLEPGAYRFLIEEFNLEKVLTGNVQPELSKAAGGQPWVAKAPINIVIGVVYERTTARYEDRGLRYVHMEVGHVGQNIHVQVISLGLGTVVVGAFDDNKVKEIVNIAPNVAPLYIMPVGKPMPR